MKIYEFEVLKAGTASLDKEVCIDKLGGTPIEFTMLVNGETKYIAPRTTYVNVGDILTFTIPDNVAKIYLKDDDFYNQVLVWGTSELKLVYIDMAKTDYGYNGILCGSFRNADFSIARNVTDVNNLPDGVFNLSPNIVDISEGVISLNQYDLACNTLAYAKYMFTNNRILKKLPADAFDINAILERDIANNTPIYGRIDALLANYAYAYSFYEKSFANSAIEYLPKGAFSIERAIMFKLIIDRDSALVETDDETEPFIYYAAGSIIWDKNLGEYVTLTSDRKIHYSSKPKPSKEEPKPIIIEDWMSLEEIRDMAKECYDSTSPRLPFEIYEGIMDLYAEAAAAKKRYEYLVNIKNNQNHGRLTQIADAGDIDGFYLWDDENKVDLIFNRLGLGNNSNCQLTNYNVRQFPRRKPRGRGRK